MKNFLTSREIEILEEGHRAAQGKKAADRIKTILLLNEGYTYKTIAHILHLDDTTIRRYIKEYDKSGIDGLLEDHYHGSNSFLSEVQKRDLEIHLRANTYQSVKGVCFYVKQAFGISYSIEGMTHLLHHLGFVYKKTKVIPGKFDPSKQAVFLKMYKILKKMKHIGDRIYFIDATHPQHNNMPHYGWIYKGETKTIKGNTGRKRLNLNGALDLENMEITVLDEKTVNSESMIRLFLKLEENQPIGTIWAIVDNASYNHSRMIKEFLKKHKRVELIFLPSYSPNLNIIERLWLFFHRKKLYGHYYETFKEFKIACLDFFKNINQYDKELRTLLTDSFQKLPA
jgi:transposase